MLQNICVTNDHEYVLFIITTTTLFHNSVMTYHWVTRVTWRVPLVEQEWLTFLFSSGVHVVKSLCEVFCRLLVVLVSLKKIILAIALSVLPWFMTSNYSFSIFKLFLISSKNCGSFCASVFLPSSTSLELWSTQTDPQV